MRLIFLLLLILVAGETSKQDDQEFAIWSDLERLTLGMQRRGDEAKNVREMTSETNGKRSSSGNGNNERGKALKEIEKERVNKTIEHNQQDSDKENGKKHNNDKNTNRYKKEEGKNPNEERNSESGNSKKDEETKKQNRESEKPPSYERVNERVDMESVDGRHSLPRASLGIGIGTKDICNMKNVRLTYGEFVTIYSKNYRQKERCKVTIKTPKGTGIGFSCKSFNLNAKGCKRESLTFSGKEDGEKRKLEYCMAAGPRDVVIQANKIKMKYKRNKLKASECSGGFVCEIYTVGDAPVVTTSTTSVVTTSTSTTVPTTTSCNPARDFCNDCGIAPVNVLNTKIVNGTEASPEEYPYHVAIFASIGEGGAQCGGSLIKPKWVLTAAHCLVNSGMKASDVTVVYGQMNLLASDGVLAVGFILHELYYDTLKGNDIALVELPSPLSYANDPTIQPICIGTEADIPYGGKAVATGWGNTEYGGFPAFLLMEVELNVITMAECQERMCLPSNANEVVCTLSDFKGPCHGDNGGPLVVQLCNGRWAQIGIMSYGIGCACENSPAVYTRVSAYADWITEKTGGTSCLP